MFTKRFELCSQRIVELLRGQPDRPRFATIAHGSIEFIPQGERSDIAASVISAREGTPFLVRFYIVTIECKVREICEPADHAIVIGEVVSGGNMDWRSVKVL
jgi:flavin reductase (DIM6/NTAB) family NADH-FMN oxidoreductase RutF